MERKKSFTGRQRRLTNRWSVKLADSLARALITVGGIGTIVAVLMVFIFLLYVAFPLFLPTTLQDAKVEHRSGQDVPLLFDIDENKILAWKLFADSRVNASRLDNGASVLEKKLFDERTVSSIASYPEGDEFALGLDDGSVVLGAFEPQVKFYQASELPEAVRNLPVGGLADFESGVIERTSHGLFRWQSVDVTTNEPISVGDAPITHVDFLRMTSDQEVAVHVATVNSRGEIVVAIVTERRTILDEVEYDLKKQLLPLPGSQTEKPWRAFMVGRGNALFALWKDGHFARYRLSAKEGPKIVEERALLSGGGELTAAMMLQGRYTLLIGDSLGQLSAWFTAEASVGDRFEVSLVQAHLLPQLDGAVTSLARSRLLRLVAAGSTTGQIKLFYVTTHHELSAIQAFDHEVGPIAIAPNDDAVVAIAGDQQWQAILNTRHPEASLPSLFRPVWYEDYPEPLHKWQSSAGSQSPEPKFGLIPLIFGTLKATFYSMLFGAPIALLAAVYTSEFVDPAVKSPIKSLIEMMASVPSVVLGFLAGLVFAPFVENVLPSLLAAFFLIPFAFLLGAQIWQSLPHKVVLRLAKYRLIGITAMLIPGITASLLAGPFVESWLFAGDFKAWLNRQQGDATGGWFLLLLPLSAVVASLAVNAYLNPWLRQRFGSLARQQFALINLVKFAIVSCATLTLAYIVAFGISAAGFDTRGGIVDTYVQRNALVVGFVMGFAIIPIIYTISEDALSTVPQHLRSASLSCGATPWQTTWRVVVPTAASGLFSAVMVGMGRAVGETMIMLMATGNVPLMDLNLFNGFRSLSANIAEELPEAPPWSTHFRILFLTGLTLLVLTFVINTAAEAIRMSFRRRASQL